MLSVKNLDWDWLVILINYEIDLFKVTSIITEPVFNTNSFFGDGDTTISLSEVNCGGFEASIIECSSKKYGDFICSSNNVVGVICQESETDKLNFLLYHLL